MTASMWACRLSVPGRLEVMRVPRPDAVGLAPGQVMLRVLAGGICGSDLPKFLGTKGPPAGLARGAAGFPLHEVAGEVVASNDPATAAGEFAVGWAAASNGAAEFVVTSGAQLHPYDPSLPPETAVLVQSLACVLYALSGMELAGTTAAVLGLGPIGLLFGHALKRAGCARVTGVDPVDRTAEGPDFGFDHVAWNASGLWAAGLDDADRPDLVVEAVGHQVSTLRHAIEACAPGGRILYFGIPDDDVYPLDMELMVRKNLTLTAGTTRRRREMLAVACRYLLAHPGLPGALVTHVFAMRDIQRAFDLARTPAAGRRKIVITVP